MTWITFKDAAEVAGVTVGELCTALSESGCVDPPEELRNLRRLRRAYTESPPNHPRVRVLAYLAVDPMEWMMHDRIVVVQARCTGALNASHLSMEDLTSWLADKSARMMARAGCELCGGAGRLRLPAVDRGYRLCPRCSTEPQFPGSAA